MRKLASIEKILDIQGIEGADRIELARVKGWQVVVKKGDFKIGDMCIYFEIDSILPKRQAFEFLGNYSKKYNGYRIRTMKLRGVLSQGLVMPLDFDEMSIMELGDDVTKQLGVKQWEFEHLDKNIIGELPEFIEDTDQERIQNLPEYFEKYKGQKFYVTEKLDGESITYYFKDGKLGICGKRYDLKVDAYMSEMKIARAINLEHKITHNTEFLRFSDVVIQGEMVGPKIQGNRLDLKEREFRVFSVNYLSPYTGIHRGYDTSHNNDKLRFEELQNFCIYFGLKTVPILFSYELADEFKDMDSIIKSADGVSRLNKERMREGLVFRLADDPNVSFKVVSNEYLLKYETRR